MSDIEVKRQALLKVYPNSPTWPEKVKNMSDAQVIAVYKKFLGEGRIR